VNVTIATTPVLATRADAIVLGVHAGDKALPPALRGLDRHVDGRIAAILAAEKFSGKPDSVTHIHLTAGQRGGPAGTNGATAGKNGAPARERGGIPSPGLPGVVVIVGLGPRKDVAIDTVRRAAAVGVRRARDLGTRRVAIGLLADRLPPRDRAHAVVEGAVLGTYVFDRYKKEKHDKVVTDLVVLAPDARSVRAVEEGARTGEAFARATWFARDLVNGPANDVHPTHLAATATALGKDKQIEVKVYDRAECRRMGMGAFLGVAAGSEQPPKFIHLTYRPRGKARRKVALIGKGVTFDAGGLDLKTAEGMLRMKNDMSGAAAVLGIMRALADLGAPVEVHGLIAATENMPSGSAVRPGDVLTAMNGTTIEIGNTDAEGRLTLADALCYAARHVEPDEVIDMATLTGACVIALGPLCSGLMSNSQPLADRLLAAARRAGERVWQLPLIDEYRDGLKSEVADINNVGPRGGGAITAGLFLREFAGETPWAHLDIAGPAFVDRDGPLVSKGGTGVLVRTLLTYLTMDGRG
jgi:leucyl aminopeptidase